MQSYFGKLRHYLFCCYDSIQSGNFACGIAISANNLAVRGYADMVRPMVRIGRDFNS